mmetsp:Transcript_44857/g.126684  ORF Transcript_44857/g.126684 Transcript_44857/m.126684 type:complete len:476 (+) Transcript_44857:185-1612(+)
MAGAVEGVMQRMAGWLLRRIFIAALIIKACILRLHPSIHRSVKAVTSLPWRLLSYLLLRLVVLERWAAQVACARRSTRPPGRPSGSRMSAAKEEARKRPQHIALVFKSDELQHVPGLLEDCCRMLGVCWETHIECVTLFDERGLLKPYASSLYVYVPKPVRQHLSVTVPSLSPSSCGCPITDGDLPSPTSHTYVSSKTSSPPSTPTTASHLRSASNTPSVSTLSADTVTDTLTRRNNNHTNNSSSSSHSNSNNKRATQLPPEAVAVAATTQSTVRPLRVRILSGEDGKDDMRRAAREGGGGSGPDRPRTPDTDAGGPEEAVVGRPGRDGGVRGEWGKLKAQLTASYDDTYGRLRCGGDFPYCDMIVVVRPPPFPSSLWSKWSLSAALRHTVRLVLRSLVSMRSSLAAFSRWRRRLKGWVMHILTPADVLTVVEPLRGLPPYLLTSAEIYEFWGEGDAPLRRGLKSYAITTQRWGR